MQHPLVRKPPAGFGDIIESSFEKSVFGYESRLNFVNIRMTGKA